MLVLNASIRVEVKGVYTRSIRMSTKKLGEESNGVDPKFYVELSKSMNEPFEAQYA